MLRSGLYFFILLVLLCQTSCSFVLNVSDGSRLSVETRPLSSVFLQPISFAKDSERTVYIWIRNSTGYQSFDIKDNISLLLSSAGYKIVEDPSKAAIKLQVNITNFAKIDQNSYSVIRRSWTDDFSAILLEKSIDNKINTDAIEGEIKKARLASNSSSISDMKLEIKTDASLADRVSVVKSGGLGSGIADIISKYRNVDLSGVILGGTIGFLTSSGSASPIILGGIAGGFIAQILAKTFEPNNYIAIADVQISEKYKDGIIYETDKRIYKQDDAGTRRTEFSVKTDTVNYRTKIVSISRKSLLSKNKAGNEMSKSIAFSISGLL